MKLSHLKISLPTSSLKANKLLRITMLLLLLLRATVLSADDQANRKLFEEIANPANSNIVKASNIEKFEGILLPRLAEIIFHYNLELPISALNPDNFALPESLNKSATDSEQDLLKKISTNPYFGYLAELDQNIDINSKNESSAEIIQASVVRLNPILKDPAAAVNFKEKFSILAPDWLSSMKFLTIRQIDDKDDLLWYFSPNLNKSSELAGSLRGDYLFNSIVSLDDLFFFGSKSTVLLAGPVTETDLLIPLPDVKSVSWTRSKDSDCMTFSNNAKSATEFLKKASLYKRTVQILEIKHKDPFSAVGRQKIFIDKETSLPILKEEFSHMGELRRFALASYSIIGGSDGQPRVAPVAINILARQGRHASILATDGRLCPQLPKDFHENQLDPSGLGKDSVELKDEKQRAIRE